MTSRLKIVLCLCIPLAWSPVSAFGQGILAEAYLEGAEEARVASDIKRAARLYALALTESHDVQHAELTARALLGAAAIHIDLGELDQGEENIRAALSLCESHLPSAHGLLISGLNGMAMIAYHRHAYEEADVLYGKVLKRLEPNEANQVLRAVVLNDCALARIALHQPYDAYRLATEAADMMHDRFGGTSRQYALCLDTLAQAYHAGNQLDVAERLSRAALEILATESGDRSPQYGAALLTLGKIQYHQGRLAESVQSVQHSVVIQERARGEAHPLVHRAKTVYDAIRQSQKANASTTATEEESRMFDEMYLGAGLQPEELTALNSRWQNLSRGERAKEYAEFQHQVEFLMEEAERSDKVAATRDGEEQLEDELMFHNLFGRHNLPADELRELRKQWDSMTAADRREAAKLFQSTSSPTTGE